jgi:hypothetical protein
MHGAAVAVCARLRACKRRATWCGRARWVRWAVWWWWGGRGACLGVVGSLTATAGRGGRAGVQTLWRSGRALGEGQAARPCRPHAQLAQGDAAQLRPAMDVGVRGDVRWALDGASDDLGIGVPPAQVTVVRRGRRVRQGRHVLGLRLQQRPCAAAAQGRCHPPFLARPAPAAGVRVRGARRDGARRAPWRGSSPCRIVQYSHRAQLDVLHEPRHHPWQRAAATCCCCALRGVRVSRRACRVPRMVGLS